MFFCLPSRNRSFQLFVKCSWKWKWKWKKKLFAYEWWGYDGITCKTINSLPPLSFHSPRFWFYWWKISNIIVYFMFLQNPMIQFWYVVTKFVVFEIEYMTIENHVITCFNVLCIVLDACICWIKCKYFKYIYIIYLYLYTYLCYRYIDVVCNTLILNLTH